MQEPKHPPLSPDALQKAIAIEAKEFEKAFRWIEAHMPPSFLDEVDAKMRMLLARNLLSFSLQSRFSQIRLGEIAFVLLPDAPDADLKVLHVFKDSALRYYRAFVSNEPPPGEKKGRLRIAILYLSDTAGEAVTNDLHLPAHFVRSMTKERLAIALEMFARAKTRDECQYEIKKNEDWKEKGAPSLQIVMAWRALPKSGFLYRLAKIILAHGLALQRVSATYINPYSADNIGILSLGIHGLHGKAAWEETDLDDLLREICLLKYFDAEDEVATNFVQPKILTGNEGHLVRNMISFVHQALVPADINLYSFDNIVEGICRHPELTTKLCKIFEAKLHPQKHNLKTYETLRLELLDLIDKLDTGQSINDLKRKNILRSALSFIDCTLKTNFYRNNKPAFSFRLDPKYLDQVPYDRKDKFPELPYAIFFIRGMHFLGFNIRFKDLARGGFRTVIPERMEQYKTERNNIFSEAYNLAYTQQKKNKDIPEGGAKTAVLLKPFEVFLPEEKLYRQELLDANLDPAALEQKLKTFRTEHKSAFLYASQRSFIESLTILVNCEDDGTLKAKSIVDYWKRPEYIYLGPDENMGNDMIVWIADYAVRKGYKPGRSFMSSKPGAGINHKEYGVTSYGVNVYLHETLLFLGIDPKKDPFTLKISGGPDGDVAGNEILNLKKFYPKTAKLVALTDVSGTIFDPEGLDLDEMASLFHKGLPIRYYPVTKLHDTSFLLDLRTKKEETSYAQLTLCTKKQNGKLIEEWLSGSEMNHLFRTNLHQVPCDVFIPAGGRPRTLNDTNYTIYLDKTGKPTSKAIVEGANLYLTPGARRALEKLGTLIIKDSSCNKGGVICSSFEVLAGLTMTEEEFVQKKKAYVEEILEIIRIAALSEAKLLLDTHKKTGQFLTDISERISERINHYKYALLDHLERETLSTNENDPLIKTLFAYCPKILHDNYRPEILAMPDIHKKAIIACHIASHTIYTQGLDANPTIASLLNP